jgi:hypothetical protein
MSEGPVYDPGGNWQLPGPHGLRRAGSYGPPSSGGGAGFEYDVETLRELAREWNDLANEFADDQSNARVLAATQGPGLEYASGGNAEQIRQSGLTLIATLQEREHYCRAMAAKFEAALGKYAVTEERHTADIKKTGGSL